MYYEINVSLNGKHLFATAERSITDRNTLNRVHDLLMEKFPESEGYELDVTLYEKCGSKIDMNKA